MVSRSRGFLSPQATRTSMGFKDREQLVSPLRRFNPAKSGIRIVESGELRVVSKAAQIRWDFTNDNASHLKNHIHNLRFRETEDNSRNFMSSGSTLMVKIGLTNINTPSVEQLVSVND